MYQLVLIGAHVPRKDKLIRQFMGHRSVQRTKFEKQGIRFLLSKKFKPGTYLSYQQLPMSAYNSHD